MAVTLLLFSVLFSQHEVPRDMKSSSDDNNLPVIVSVTGGYMEPAATLEQPDFTQWVHVVFANWYCLWNYTNVDQYKMFCYLYTYDNWQFYGLPRWLSYLQYCTNW